MKPVSCGTQVSLLVGSPRVPQTWWYTVGASGEWWTQRKGLVRAWQNPPATPRNSPGEAIRNVDCYSYYELLNLWTDETYGLDEVHGNYLYTSQ